jgi:hypothetical protein
MSTQQSLLVLHPHHTTLPTSSEVRIPLLKGRRYRPARLRHLGRSRTNRRTRDSELPSALPLARVKAEPTGRTDYLGGLAEDVKKDNKLPE